MIVPGLLRRCKDKIVKMYGRGAKGEVERGEAGRG